MATCGDLPILGDFQGSYGPIPDDCKTCIEASCCDEATACSADAACREWSDCVAAAGCSAASPTSGNLNDRCGQCAPLTGSSLQLSTQFRTCRATCDACVDLRCAGKPWPTLDAPTLGIQYGVTSFTAATPFPGVLVKVCDDGDHDCKTPLPGGGTTATDGTVALTMPSGPGAFGGYFDLSGPSIAPSVFELHVVDLANSLNTSDAPDVTETVRALDPNTWGLLRGSYNLPPSPPADRSRVTVQVWSCGNTNLAGVTVTSSNADADTHFGYVVGGLPSTTATETDTSGLAGWENHPAGLTTFTVTKVSSGQKLLTFDRYVRGGVVWLSTVPPGPTGS